MLFIYRLPFHQGFQRALTDDSSSFKAPGRDIIENGTNPYLPITVHEDNVTTVHQSYRPFPWLLDTGCAPAAFVSHPGALRRFLIPRSTILGAGKDIPDGRIGTASNRSERIIYSKIGLWLHSNLELFKRYPLKLTCDPGVSFRDDSEDVMMFGERRRRYSELDASEEILWENRVPRTCYVVGMGSLIKAEIIFEIVSGQKLLSVWVPYHQWAIQYPGMAMKFRQLMTPMAKPYDVWSKGSWDCYLSRNPRRG
jgi:hypothetical protein